jgi:hypothetical protein
MRLIAFNRPILILFQFESPFVPNNHTIKRMGTGGELPLALGGPRPPQGQGFPKKKKIPKKKNLINFTHKFCYFYNFGPPNFYLFIFFSIWPSQLLNPSSALGWGHNVHVALA